MVMVMVMLVAIGCGRHLRVLEARDVSACKYASTGW